MVPNGMINSDSRRALNGRTAWLYGKSQQNPPRKLTCRQQSRAESVSNNITGDSTDTAFLSDLVSHPPRPPNKAQDRPTPRMQTVPSGPASKLLTVNHYARSEDIGSAKVSTGFPSHPSLVLVGASTR
jgi:hypothetical protein